MLNMEARKLKPSSRYLTKCLVGLTLIMILVLVSGLALAAIVSHDEGPQKGAVVSVVFVVLSAVWYIPALFLTLLYFRSLSYEIKEDEVIVNVGIWTRSTKHVPYRTVTNLKVNRDIFDRWFFNLGSLNVQTAGMSGATGAEESLVGLPNIDEVYGLVSDRLRRYRGAMSPTGTGEDVPLRDDTLREILSEVRAIRSALEK